MGIAEWEEWARDTLSYLGVPQETSADYTPADLRLALSYRTGLIAGTVAKWGRLDTKAGLVPRVLDVLDHAIEQGVSRGWNRAHKHTDTPTEQEFKGYMEEAIRGAVGEWFIFPDQHE